MIRGTQRETQAKISEKTEVMPLFVLSIYIFFKYRSTPSGVSQQKQKKAPTRWVELGALNIPFKYSL